MKETYLFSYDCHFRSVGFLVPWLINKLCASKGTQQNELDLKYFYTLEWEKLCVFFFFFEIVVRK